MAIKLGTEATDKVTGVTGTVTSRTIFLHDCVHVRLQPKSADPTKVAEAVWAIESNLNEYDGVETPRPAILGKTVTDSITGFKGIAVGYTEYHYAIARVTIQPKKLDKDGKPIEQQVFDLPQIKEFAEFQPKTIAKAQRSGGPGDCAPRSATCIR